MHEHKLQQMIESTIRYLHKSASDIQTCKTEIMNTQKP